MSNWFVNGDIDYRNVYSIINHGGFDQLILNINNRCVLHK